MERDIQDTYLSELSEHLSQNWSKIGTRIGWFDPSIGLKDPGFEDPERIRQAAEESIETGAQVAVELPSGVRGLAIPVFSGGRCLGSLIGLLPGSLAESSPGLLEIFVRHLEHLQERNQREEELTVLSQELSGRYEELSLIYKLGQDLQITDDPGRFLERFSQDLLDLIGARGLMLLVVHRLTGKESCFEVGQLPVSGDSAKSVCRYILGLGQNRHEPIILSDISAHPSLVHVLKTTRMELLAWPLKPSAASQGILVAVGAGRSEEFDSSDAKLLGSIAEHTASFLQNRFLLADIEELLTGFLTSLVSAIDAKDPYTRGHSQRVAYIAQVIAESLGLSKKEISQIYMAGLLHDVGKIGVNEQVLAKPGKLTKEEFITIQQHPVIGSKILSSVRQLRNILPGVMHHHERYDGKGYPEGLVGEQIPLMGLVVGLADSFDAITSERTYHSAMPLQEAVEEVKRCSGSQFSPAVVQGLLACDLVQMEQALTALSTHLHEPQKLPSLNWLE